jgi:hypothetical protein
MSRHQVYRRCLGAALALSLGLGACGKENRPSAPEGEESRYIYPQVYPKPASVVPQEEEVAEEEAKTGETPTHVGGIDVFPTNTRSKTIYDSGPIE